MKNCKMRISILMALFITPTISLAETKYEKAYGECIDAAGTMNNSVMIGCSEAVSVLAKQDMTTFYKNIEEKSKQYGEEERMRIMTLLETGQKAWIQYRDNYCALSQILSAQEPYCLMLVNAQRAEELKELAE